MQYPPISIREKTYTTANTPDLTQAQLDELNRIFHMMMSSEVYREYFERWRAKWRDQQEFGQWHDHVVLRLEKNYKQGMRAARLISATLNAE